MSDPAPSVNTALPKVYIVLSIYQPNLVFLKEQLRSLANQSFRNFSLITVIADTRALPMVQPLIDQFGLTSDYVLPPTPLSAVQAFEAGLKRGLDTATESTAYFAFCDQDDIWRKDRLSKGVRALKQHDVDLVHSDCCLIDVAGDMIHPSCVASENRLKKPQLRDLLYRNAVTGMTMLLTRDLAQRALPFPRQSGTHFYHDLWLALLAQTGRGMHLINEPLVQYRQHDNNLVGALGLTARPKPALNSLSWKHQKAGSYALAKYLAHAVAARQSVPAQALRPFLGPKRARLWFWVDALRYGASGQFKLARIALAYALVSAGRTAWIMRNTLQLGLPQARARIDQKLYRLSPGVSPDAITESPPPKPHTRLQDTRMHAAWQPDFNAIRPMINILLPSLNPPDMFAGLTTALDLGAGLADRGHLVRFIATDQPVAAPAVSLEFIRARCTHHGRKNLTLACGVQSDHITSHRQDRFIATAWWTAHIATKLIKQHGYATPKFHYLIQDHEPHFYPWGRAFADAQASYHLPFTPIFNTNLLQRYFADQGHDFAHKDALTFHPSIPLDHYFGPRPHSDVTQILLYGRPDVARNMFGPAVEGLAQFLTTHQPPPQSLRLVSAGQAHADITFEGGYTLKSLGKLPLQDYPDLLHRSHIGLSLMYSPHPSHVPLEMAAAGMRVVTNGFGPKDLSRLSPSITSTLSTPEALSKGLGTAWKNRETPIPDADRALDLTQLGDPFGKMLDLLSTQFTTSDALAAE